MTPTTSNVTLLIPRHRWPEPPERAEAEAARLMRMIRRDPVARAALVAARRREAGKAEYRRSHRVRMEVAI